MNAAELHADAIVIDTTCPLARIHKYLDWYREGGATAIAPTITGASGNARSGFAMIGGWHRYVRERDDALIVHQAEDIEQAKREGKVGLILHCQGTAIVEDEIDLLDAYHEAGLRVVQLCYNTKNLVGDGASERTDSGLSYFGLRLVERCNALGLLVDCSHTGHRTSMDAVEASNAPVVITHANARAVQNNGRNVEDELIKAIADCGGIVGTVGFPPFLTWDGQPTLDHFIDDIVYKADLVGIDHTGIGIDYYEGQYPVEEDETAMARYRNRLETGQWRAEEYPPPPYKFPEGIETPRTLDRLTDRLVERQFSEDDIRKVLGLNWMRVYREVWHR
ncbi:MAG: peptidase M19 [Alphaproteobacteria bacterium]|nr:peptidase M19 [Alphaproteobacteria bacterium]